tara:strand:+ start:932 stop:1246 length:315 start_codon:yes stop_codon:yes gene_type:complete
MDSVASFSWYEVCMLHAAVRMLRKKTIKDRQRSSKKFGDEWVDGHLTKAELLISMEKSLKSLERQLQQHHGVDSVDAYHQTHEEKLNAKKIVKLSINQDDAGGE